MLRPLILSVLLAALAEGPNDPAAGKMNYAWPGTLQPPAGVRAGAKGKAKKKANP